MNEIDAARKIHEGLSDIADAIREHSTSQLGIAEALRSIATEIPVSNDAEIDHIADAIRSTLGSNLVGHALRAVAGMEPTR